MHGDYRRYYCLSRAYGRLAFLVLRNDLDLDDLIGGIVDASVGWEMGVEGFVWEENVGKKHTKITIYRELYGRRWDKTLSEILRKSPV